MARTIKLKLLDREALVPVVTTARTLAEFKKEPAVEELNIQWESVKLINKADKASFDIDHSVLPEVDSIMFITPTKTKSGAMAYKEAKKYIKDYKDKGGIVPFNYTNATTAQLNDFINSLNKQESTPVNEEVYTIVEEPEEIVVEIQALLSHLTEKVKLLSNTSVKTSNFFNKELQEFKDSLAEYLTKDELSLEAESLQLLFS